MHSPIARGHKEINIYDKELWVMVVVYKKYTAMHGQQNIKQRVIVLRVNGAGA